MSQIQPSEFGYFFRLRRETMSKISVCSKKFCHPQKSLKAELKTTDSRDIDSSSTLRKEVECSSETWENFLHLTGRHVAYDNNLHIRRCDNLKSHKLSNKSLKLKEFKVFSGRSRWPRGLRRRSTTRLLRLWVRIPPGHGCLSVVSVVCCQEEVSATRWSLVQRSTTDCDALSCVI